MADEKNKRWLVSSESPAESFILLPYSYVGHFNGNPRNCLNLLLNGKNVKLISHWLVYYAVTHTRIKQLERWGILIWNNFYLISTSFNEIM